MENIKYNELIDKLVERIVSGVRDTNTDDFKLSDIRGCQIVRRNSSDIYQNNLLQVALARPIRQGLLETQLDNSYYLEEGQFIYSPYYPTGLLQTNDLYITPIYYIYLFDSDTGRPRTEPSDVDALLRAKTDDVNNKLFQIFSSEIDFRRNDVLARLSSSGIKLEEECIVSGLYKKYKNHGFKSYIES